MRRLLALPLLAACCAPLLAGCGNTIQNQPMSNSTLEQLVAVEGYPVYWLGGSFEGMELTSVSEDPGGAYTLQYGDCVGGGPSTCRTPVEVISSPNNAFLPSTGVGTSPVSIRGVKGVLAQHGAVIELRTGPIVLDVRALRRPLAFAAAAAIVPINEPGRPGERLPAALPDTGFGERAIESQYPKALHLLPPIPASAPRP